MTQAPLSFGFTLDALLRRSWSVFYSHVGTFLLLSACIYAPALIIGGIIVGGIYAGGDEVVILITALFFALLTILLNFIVMAVIVHAAFQALRGQRVSIAASFGLAGRRIVWVVILALLQTILVGIGLFLLIIPGIFIAVILYVSMACCLVERLGPIGSMGRSAALTKGHRWKLFGAMVIIFVFMMIISIVFTFAAESVVGPGLISAIFEGLVSVIYSAYMSVTVAVAYHDLRATKEGIDIEQIAALFE